MFEIIMLLGFLYAATSQIRSGEPDRSQEDSEERRFSSPTIRASQYHHKLLKKEAPVSTRNHMRAA